MTAILGLSAFYHDSAAALVVDGRIVAAAQEERFSRQKHDHEFPTHAVDFCLKQGGLTPDQLDYVGFYDKPLLKFGRLIETYLAYAPRGFESFLQAMPLWLRQKLHLPREMSQALGGAYAKRYIFTEHHESHAASAFFPSPFDEAAILTMDGVGEWATMSYGVGKDNRIALSGQLDFPHSLGLLYSAFTYYCGFEVNSGEYKLMGLAPYGQPRYVDRILQHLLDLKADGSFRMDMSYFNYCEGLTMTSPKFHDLFGGPPRKSNAPLTERDMDIAASVQKVTEEIVLRIATHVHRETGMSKLCLAGGVALNCVANGRVLREGPFDDIWIQPAAGDAGGALGAALFIWYQLLGNARTAKTSDDQHGSLLGPAFGDEEIRQYLDSVGAVYHRIADDDALCADIATRIADGKVVGWFQGQMEFGPRALGARSILGDARSPAMQAVMNLKVKFRESFRPFAPAVLREHVSEYFGTPDGLDSPYMLLVAPVLESRRRQVDPHDAERTGLDKLAVYRSEIPAATHVDYSARIQTVDRARHGLYHGVIDAFYRMTGCPVVVNTSFNLGWDPIVCTPKEAYHTFMSSDIDVLCVGHQVLAKAEQPAERHALALPGARAYTSEPWCCPCGHGAALTPHDNGLRCTACGHKFAITDGIPQLFWPHEKFGKDTDVTEAVKAFYEETPFPNYDEHDSVRSLIDKSRRGIYAHMLNEGLPYNGRILEVGCGTGQLTNFLGISCREVVGVDLCLNSLRLAEHFRSEHELERVRFAQMNLFRPCFTPGQFDVILCNGVLHHTADPYGGFKGLVPLLKPGGHIIIGLYNTYGRLMTDVRRAIFRFTGGRATWLDPYLRSTKMSRDKRRAWFADQYQHPHESKHTIGEVLDWFDETGLDFVRGIPSVTGGSAGEGDLFAPEPAGSAFDHATVQAKQIITGSREGGFFLMIGRRPEAASSRPASTPGNADELRRGLAVAAASGREGGRRAS
jgi:carbamoyltransferase